MGIYKKKPILVEAFLWAGETDLKRPKWFKEALDKPWGTPGSARILTTFQDGIYKETFIEIFTPEGVHRANLGSYIIKGIKGEIYPCKADIFERTYTKVAETSAESIINTSD